MQQPPDKSRSCRPRKRRAGCYQPTDFDDHPMSLTEIVTKYQTHCQDRASSEYQFYASRSSLDDAVEIAAFAKKDSAGNRHSHQYRLTSKALEEAYQRLQEAELRNCSTFHELFTVIEDTIHPIRGIGPLMVYDTALRIGAYLGLEPEKIYLHRGTRVGAKAIGLGRGKSTLEVSELPLPFQQLRPREIEDCLCIYKKELQTIHGT